MDLNKKQKAVNPLFMQNKVWLHRAALWMRLVENLTFHKKKWQDST